MTLLLFLALLAPPELDDLVWKAVDAPPAQVPAATKALRGHPAATWQSVQKILAQGPSAPGRAFQAAQNLAQCRSVFRLAKWERGDVKIHNLGAHPEYWYALRPPTDARRGSTRAPVLIDLGAALHRTTPAHWAAVAPNWTMIQAAEAEGIPMSMTAGPGFQSLLLSIVADLERRCRIDRDRVFLTGYSRAGNATWYFGLHWPDRWAGIVPVSGYYPFERVLAPNLATVPVFAVHGADRMHRAANTWTRKAARLIKAELLSSPGRGVDDPYPEKSWAWMEEKRRDPLPKRVRYAMFDPRHREAYWMRIEKVRKTGGRRAITILATGGVVQERVFVNRRVASVDARITDDNGITVTTQNIAVVKLYLSSARFDLKKPIRIRLGARSIVHTPKPSIATLLRHYRHHRDHRRLFPAEITLEP